MPDALPARASALRRLAQALIEAEALLAADARVIHPKAVATLDAWQAEGWVALEVTEAAALGAAPSASDGAQHAASPTLPTLTDEQAAAVEAIRDADGFAPFLLHGVTGSGKTEVYLRALAAILAARPDAQALVLVPEINLTPQFEAAFRARFAALDGTSIVTLHSGLAEGERARNWFAAHSGRARIVLGTRLAILASLPKLAIIVVDEEHDPAYKQQEGLRYSARDLAIWRAKQLGLPVVLGSATPSLESWWQADQGRYTRLDAVAPRGRRSGVAHRQADRSRRGAAARTGFGGRLVGAADCGVENAPGKGRAKPGVSEPPRLRAATGLRRLRLGGRLPALQRLRRVAQARARVALPSLRLGGAHSAFVPGLRQRRYRAARARHAACRGDAGNRSAGRARAAHRRRQHAAAKAARRRCSPTCTRATSTSWWARR